MSAELKAIRAAMSAEFSRFDEAFEAFTRELSKDAPSRQELAIYSCDMGRSVSRMRGAVNGPLLLNEMDQGQHRG